MLSRNLVICVFFPLLLCLVVVLCFGGPAQHCGSTPTFLSGPMEMTLRLDRDTVNPGDSVILEELVPSKMNAPVRGVLHELLRIGDYDKVANTLRNRKPSLFSSLDPDKELPGLHESIGFSHPAGFEIITPRHKGMEFHFRPKFLGIYLITASWHLEKVNEAIFSNPVVLIVKPPLDSTGKPIVKPEWIDDEN